MILGIQDGVITDDNPEHSGVWHNYVIGDKTCIFGHIRLEIIPSSAIIHINPINNITRSKLRELREANDNLAVRVLQHKWGLEEAYFTTNNKFLVNFFSRGLAKEVGEVNNKPIYRVNIEDVLCRKSQQL